VREGGIDLGEDRTRVRKLRVRVRRETLILCSPVAHPGSPAKAASMGERQDELGADFTSFWLPSSTLTDRKISTSRGDAFEHHRKLRGASR
jgi:hypothetical protein